VAEDGGDYTVHIVVGVDPQNRIYLLDLWRQQTSSDQWVEVFCDLVLEWQWAEEGGQIKAGDGHLVADFFIVEGYDGPQQ
jgi:hypothetical protein